MNDYDMIVIGRGVPNRALHRCAGPWWPRSSLEE